MSRGLIKPTLYVMVGLPASGKSGKAKDIFGAIVRSSDELRQELLGNIEDMSKNKEIFDILYSLIRADLYGGSSVVYDATNIGAKYRKEFLDSISLLECKKVCVFMNTPYEICLDRNLKRERVVPEPVMERMKNNLQEPTLDEGWDEIQRVDYEEDQ